jgi:putative intracellular protease/amidase
LPEVAHPYKVFQEAGYEVVFVSPKGGKTSADVGSVEAFKEDAGSQAFLNNATAMKATNETLSPSQVKAGDYVAIFYAGGHGPMFDLPENADIAAIAAQVYEKHNGVVGAVCHGPAGLVPIKLSNGDALVKGKRVCAFTDAEEDAMALTAEMPFSLESKLVALGATFAGGPDWGANVVSDQRVVTGQNPASATDTAKACVAALKPACCGGC